MYIALNVYIDSYIVQHHRISLYKYGAIKLINIYIYKIWDQYIYNYTDTTLLYHPNVHAYAVSE